MSVPSVQNHGGRSPWVERYRQVGNAADAELRVYPRQVAAASRVHFEAALEHVALHEGLILPP